MELTSYRFLAPGPVMVGRTVAQYMSAGVAALHLEDQSINKRCGHLRGKEIVEERIFLSRIKAAVKMREQTPGDIIIIARTDALQSLGYEAAVGRLKKAIAEGADVAFLEGIRSKAEGRRVCQDLSPAPVLLNMAHGGVTPSISVAEAKDMGFKVIIFPGLAIHRVYTAVTEAMAELRDTGDVDYSSQPLPGPQELFGICGLQEAIDFDAAVGGDAYANGV
jgi:2-methylisocitrate lyase-like PEP mutase family enzyme